MMSWIVSLCGSYLIGSIPFGVLIGRARGIDIRDHGSKNVGATNVGRVLGRNLGFLCFALDVAKGAAPVLVAGAWHELLGKSLTEFSASEMWWWLGVAIAAVLGHMFSIFLRFSGGKGVATSFGAMAAMWPLLTFPAFGALVVWYTTLRLTHYVSLSSMLAAIALPVGYLLRSVPNAAFDQPIYDTLLQVGETVPPLLVTSAMALLVIYKHRSNIRRLVRGEEPRVGGGGRRGAMPTPGRDSDSEP